MTVKKINRPKYLDFLIRSKDMRTIKAISGIRRCGKSALLDTYRNWLTDNGVAQEQIISINFEEPGYEHISDYRSLYNHIKPLLLPDKVCYVFLDEIQHVRRYEIALDSLFFKRNVDLYISGSNAYFMSGELATLLTGRYTELKMFPLSFAEYCEGIALYAPDSLTGKTEKYASYTNESALPYVLRLGGRKEDVREYLSGIYSGIMLKDIVARLRVSDVITLESIVRFLLKNTGTLLSANKIANAMTSAGRKIDQKTAEKYVKGLLDSLLIYQAKRYDIKGKQYLSSLEKYYAADIGLRQYLLGSADVSEDHVLENLVYLELIRRGNDVYAGHLPDGNVDFAAINSEGIAYYQVAARVSDKKNLRRKLANLKKTRDNNPKFLLTLDETDTKTNHKGIEQLNALDWLLAE